MSIYRIGQIVPSSNTTMETEIPAVLRAREAVDPSASPSTPAACAMQKVTKEELERHGPRLRPPQSRLADARVDVLGYACLVAIMCRGTGYHRGSEERLRAAPSSARGAAPVVTSAGALVDGRSLGAEAGRSSRPT